MMPKHIKLPDGEIVPVLGWVKDLYRIPGGHIKMKLAQAVEELSTDSAKQVGNSAIEVVHAIGTTIDTIITEVTEKPKKAGRPRKVRVAE